MKKHQRLLIQLCFLAFSACQSKPPEAEPALSKDQLVQKNLDSLKKLATEGDLIVRLGDDFLSYYIKNMNESDHSFSHAGLIVNKDSQKLVAHITPDSINKDRITYIPLDSFVSKNKTLQCALFRYQISSSEKEKAIAIVDSYKSKDIRFDRLYDLTSDTMLYCSEMISKALTEATDERLRFKTIPAPLKMLPLLNKYFSKQLEPETIAKRRIMTIDNLYNIPECRPVMQFTLKHLPGQ